MAYVRKTYDEYLIQGLYGGEWETVTTEETRKAAKEMLECYNENETRYPHRIKVRRVRITKGEKTMTFRIEKWDTKGESKCVGNYGGGYTEQDLKELIRGYRKTDKIGNIQFYQRKGSRTLWMVIEE